MPALMPTAGAPDEIALIARARDGDRAAFARLIEDRYAFIFRTAWKWSGNREDAEDIAQQVCVKLATAIGQFDGRSAFSSWLYRITLNAVRDLQRSRGRQARGAQSLAEVMPGTAPPDQEDALAESELWAAVRRLPDRQRDAVLLVYADELSHAEAAAAMGVKEPTVSWYVHEARKTLRGLL
jgi:RNA polymerase sigma-70 factor, ECF subfamily